MDGLKCSSCAAGEVQHSLRCGGDEISDEIVEDRRGGVLSTLSRPGSEGIICCGEHVLRGVSICQGCIGLWDPRFGEQSLDLTSQGGGQFIGGIDAGVRSEKQQDRSNLGGLNQTAERICCPPSLSDGASVVLQPVQDIRAVEEDGPSLPR